MIKLIISILILCFLYKKYHDEIILRLLKLINYYKKPSLKILENNTDYVYSPAYGKIMDVIYNDDGTIIIPIFLSITDIHYQMFPISGELLDVTYDATGQFNVAYKRNKSNNNEKAIHTIKNKNGVFKVYQIAGLVARNIYYFNNPVKKIECGELLGFIDKGSRVDIIIPNATNFKLLVNKGDKVYGTNTLLGYY
jgi:phosphatidylserine decarboxylase precursor-related protein